MGKTLYFHCRGRGSIPGQGTRSHMCMVQPEKVGVGGQAVGAEQSKVRSLSKKTAQEIFLELEDTSSGTVTEKQFIPRHNTSL